MLKSIKLLKKYTIPAITILAGAIFLFIVPDYLLMPLNMALTSYPTPENVAHLLFLYPLLNGLIITVGAALILLAMPIFRGDFWARALAAGFLALPAIGGAFIIETIPLFSQALVKNGIILLAIALLPYFAILLDDDQTSTHKIIKLCLFFLFILTTAVNLFSASEALIQKNTATMVFNSANHFYHDLGIYSIFIGAALSIPGIALLAGRSTAGLWILSLGVTTMLIGSSRLSVFEHPHMILYLPAALITALTLSLLIIFGNRLVDHRKQAMASKIVQ